jgi:hypothetical protein
MVQTNKSLKSFADYISNDFSETLPEGTYRLRVREASVGEWPDGRPRLDITTEVMEGEFKGRYGPRHQWSIGDSDGVTHEGVEFHVDGEREKMKLGIQVTAIHNGKQLNLTNDTSFDSTMLTEIGKQITGDEFIGVVVTDRKGYPKIATKGVYSMSSPPSTYKSTTNFSLDNV